MSYLIKVLKTYCKIPPFLKYSISGSVSILAYTVNFFPESVTISTS